MEGLGEAGSSGGVELGAATASSWAVSPYFLSTPYLIRTRRQCPSPRLRAPLVSELIRTRCRCPSSSARAAGVRACPRAPPVDELVRACRWCPSSSARAAGRQAHPRPSPDPETTRKRGGLDTLRMADLVERPKGRDSRSSALHAMRMGSSLCRNSATRRVRSMGRAPNFRLVPTAAGERRCLLLGGENGIRLRTRRQETAKAEWPAVPDAWPAAAPAAGG
jgi:hypothetical protein